MKPGSVRPNQRLQEASGRVWGGQEVDPRRIGISAGAKRAVANMGAGLPSDFHTAWVQKLWGRRQRSGTVVVVRNPMEVPP